MKYIYALLISLLLPTAVFAQSVPVSWLRNVASGFLTPLNIRDNVGIGTTSPASLLHLSGNGGVPQLIISGTAAGQNMKDWRFVADSTSLFLGTLNESTTATGDYAIKLGRETNSNDVDYIEFATNNEANKMRFTNSGNLGIGTTTPGVARTVIEGNSNILSVLGISNTTNTASNRTYVNFYDSATEHSAAIGSAREGSATDWGLIFRTGSGNSSSGPSDRLYISAAGNVGIGTTSPGRPLSLEGAGGAQIRIQRSDSPTSNGMIEFAGNDSVVDSSISYNNRVGGALTFETGGPTNTRMTIDASGNVGIGTTTPWTKLSVTGSTTIAGGPLIVLGAANTPISADTDWYRQFGLFRKDINDYTFTTFENRNGGSNASVDLLWNNDRTTALSYYADLGFNSSAFNNPAFGNLNVANAWYGYNTDGPILWATATTSTAGYFDVTTGGYSSSRFRITSTGNIGIGTTTPVANLQVTNSTSNATTTVEFGRSGQNKGSCIKLYDEVGTAYYLKVATGGTLNLSATACATVTGF